MDATARAKQVFFGYIQTQCVQAMLELGVPDALAAGPRTAAALAAELGAAADPLARALDALVCLGLFQRDADGNYAHNAASECLRTDHENSMADLFGFCGRESYRTFGNLTAAVRDNRPVFPDAWGQPFWQHLRDNPERKARFGRAMERQSEHLLQALVAQFNFADLAKSGVPQIADIGGSKGQFFRPLARAGVAFEGIVFDLPELAPLAERFLADEKLDTCRFIAGDFFRAVPAGADLYVLKFVLHDWRDEEAIIILKTVRAAMKPGSRLMVIELLRGGDPSPWSHLSDMIMLTTFGAKERTEAEYRGLLDAAGLRTRTCARVAGAPPFLLASVD
ncbi:MAG: hypothetical protein KC620_07845 [Myxococcales bacterium]|nr:hypothetical protein [Myxococcales bacterium]